MYEVIEHFGKGLLGLLAVSGAITIVLNCVKESGAIDCMIRAYMFGLCG